MVIGMIKISSINIYILFGPGDTHTLISAIFIIKNSVISSMPLEIDFRISTPNGEVILINSICKACILGVEDREIKIDLLVLELKDFDLILAMDWLATYHASIDYFEKVLKFQILGQLEFSFLSNKLSSH